MTYYLFIFLKFMGLAHLNRYPVRIGHHTRVSKGDARFSPDIRSVGLTGGVCKEQGRIQRAMMTPAY